MTNQYCVKLPGITIEYLFLYVFEKTVVKNPLVYYYRSGIASEEGLHRNPRIKALCMHTILDFLENIFYGNFRE